MRLEFLSGITVQGRLHDIYRQEQRNLLLSFDECTVTDLQGRVLFEPGWGRYDMAVGARITSVYGGVADREALQLHKPPPAGSAIATPEDSRLMALYRLAHQLRTGAAVMNEGTAQTISNGLADYPDEWLLRLELLGSANSELAASLRDQLASLALARRDLAALIEMGLAAD